MKRLGKGPRLAWLLLGVNAIVLLLPVAALGIWRIYDLYLLRQTERQLIAQSVVVGEAFRSAYWRELGVTGDDPRPPETLAPRRQSNGEEERGMRATPDRKYLPVEPLIDIGTKIAPHEELEQLPEASGRDTPARRAGSQIEPMLQRAQIFNLSGIRVLDAQGCVVATTGGHRGRCMTPLEEVQRALAGQYAATARKRLPARPLPPLGSIQRRGKLRVFTALPIFSNGEVLAVVVASRTGLDALSSLWQIRRPLVASIGAVVLVVIVMSLLFARAIASPMRSITRKAQAVARGEPESGFVAQGFTPAEIRLLSEALDAMTSQLRGQAQYVREFATTVSHELKTPIAAIRGAVELLQDWDSMEPAQRERFLSNMDQDAERMQRLVTRLLALAKIESGQVEPREELAVERSVQRLLERFGPGVELSIDADTPASLRISEEHLAAVLGNLVENALRHGKGEVVRVHLGKASSQSQPAGTSAHASARAGTATSSAAPPGQALSPATRTTGASRPRVLLSVSDRGDGISQANQAKIGQRFFTTERDRGGTGLGLSIVKAIAEARGGELRFESSSAGTTFWVTL